MLGRFRRYSLSRQGGKDIGLLGGSSIAAAMKFFGMGLGYVLITMISREFGTEGVGKYSLIYSFVQIIDGAKNPESGFKQSHQINVVIETICAI